MNGRPRQVSVQEARTRLSRMIHGAPKPRRLGGAPGLVEYMADDFNAEIDDFGAYAPSESKSMR